VLLEQRPLGGELIFACSVGGRIVGSIVGSYLGVDLRFEGIQNIVCTEAVTMKTS